MTVAQLKEMAGKHGLNTDKMLKKEIIDTLTKQLKK
jgi:hypothetical protein